MNGRYIFRYIDDNALMHPLLDMPRLNFLREYARYCFFLVNLSIHRVNWNRILLIKLRGTIQISFTKTCRKVDHRCMIYDNTVLEYMERER